MIRNSRRELQKNMEKIHIKLKFCTEVGKVSYKTGKKAPSIGPWQLHRLNKIHDS